MSPSPPVTFPVLGRREEHANHFTIPSLLAEARVGPDMDACATIQLKGQGRQLATFDLRCVFATDRDHHAVAFMQLPAGGFIRLQPCQARSRAGAPGRITAAPRAALLANTAPSSPVRNVAPPPLASLF